jgi:hypothetical protein
VPFLSVLVIKCPTHHFELTILEWAWAWVYKKQIEDVKSKRAQTWTQIWNTPLWTNHPGQLDVHQTVRYVRQPTAPRWRNNRHCDQRQPRQQATSGKVHRTCSVRHETVQCTRRQKAINAFQMKEQWLLVSWGYKRGPYAPLLGHQAFLEHTTTPRLSDHALEVFERDLSAFFVSLFCHFVIALSSLHLYVCCCNCALVCVLYSLSYSNLDYDHLV